MFVTQLTPQQRIDKCVVQIMDHERYRALAGILMIGERRVMDTIPNFPPGLPQTAMTNGRDEWYANEFIDSLNDAELRGLIIHECGHKMYRHFITWIDLKKINPIIANMAMDYMLNVRIHDDNLNDGFAKLPPGGCFDEKYRGWSTPDIFRDLLKQAKEGEEGEGEGEGEGEEGFPSKPGSGKGEGTGIDAHDWDGAAELTDEEKHQLERDVDEAIRQGALVAGKTGSGGNRDIEELLKPQVDWKQVLRDFITELCAGQDLSTWRRPNRKYMAGGVYMPSGISETVDEICVEIDMSGSTWNIVKYFIGELIGVAKQVMPKKIHILYWDTKVCRHEQYTMDDIDNLFNTTKPAGGGGTVVQCVPDYCAEHGIRPQCHVVLTDGYLGGSWGIRWNAPVLWCICGNKSDKPNNGKYVYIDEVR